jgi:hypothetical protein
VVVLTHLTILRRCSCTEVTEEVTKVKICENGHGCRAGGAAGTTAGRRLHDMTMSHGLLSATHGRAEHALVRDGNNSLSDSLVGRALG